MSAHDDFMDMRDAYRRYEKTYEAWGRAVDGKLVLDEQGKVVGLTEPSPQSVALCQATRMYKALDYVIQCAQEAKKGMERRGWPKPGERKRRKKAKPERRFV